MLTKREFLGEDYYKWACQDRDLLLQFRNKFAKVTPTEVDKLLMKINKDWIAFYKRIL